MHKKKCLLILSRLPYPPHSGYQVKTYNLLMILNRLYNLSVVIVTDEKENPDVRNFLEQYCLDYKIYYFPKWRCQLNTLSTFLFSKKPLQSGYYFFKQVKKEVQKIIPQMDIVIPTLVRTTEYVKSQQMKTSSVRIFDIVDSYALSYLRSCEKTNSFLWQFLYKIEAHRLHNYEKEQIKLSDASLFVNRKEQEYWNTYGNCFCLPNGVNKDLLEYTRESDSLHAVAFFGKMDYPPNVDAVRWFLKHVFNSLDQNMDFYIVGTSPCKELYTLAQQNPRIKITGYMKDPYSLLARCKAIVSPMQTGGGIQNKILETMALGQVNILSSLAEDPIGGTDGIHYLVADDPQTYIKHITAIVNDPALEKEIGTNARAFVTKNYSWDTYSEILDSIINTAISKKC